VIALCLIVKGSDDSEAKLLDECLKSVHKHVDGIFIQLNAPKGKNISQKVRQVAEKYTKEIKVFEWTGNFVSARNANFAQVPKKYEHIIWLDTDDTVENPEKIREVASILPKDTQSVYVQYDYDHDQFGNVLVSHWNCRLIRNNGSFTWKSSIDDSDVSVHETLVPKRSVKQASNDEFKVIHHADNAKRDRSLARNIELLEGMYERQKDTRIDPRILFYLATHYFDAGRYYEAKNLFIQYLQTSGWAEERSEAHVFMGKIFVLDEDDGAAKRAFLLALGENVNNQTAYLELGRLDSREERYEQAAKWLETALTIKQGPQAMVLFSGFYELYMLLAQCYTEMGGKKLSEALKMADKGLKLRPLDPEAVENRDKINNLVGYQKDMKAVARLVRKIKDDKPRLKTLLDGLPRDLTDSPVVIGARHNLKEVKKWPKKSIAIYCGNGPLGIWGPWSLEKGIGGSEEAVIRLSNELAREGWEVTVYATPGEKAGLFHYDWSHVPDGLPSKMPDHEFIDWKQYWEFNPDDEFDVVVAWRMPSFFDNEIKARKQYLWLHDVMEKEEFTDERLKRIDKVIVLSKYHESLFPMLPKEKVFLSANGITASDFDGISEHRDTQRIIYMSSHIRGLALLYDIWPEVKRAVPDAKLDIYYGWESYVSMNHNNPGNQPGGMAWMRMMQTWVKDLDGVTDHGKIGQQEIVEEIQKSGVWAYPCPFPEIYCITAIKAQAGGAVPVSSDFAALDETVQFGKKIHMSQKDEDTPVGNWDKKEVEEYKEALIDALKHPEQFDRTKMIKWAKSQSWESVAKSWSKEMA
jgi:tetratricopeptide (TPR) repeat protein